jgi:hypothetical protein
VEETGRFVTCRWLSLGPQVSSTNKTERHDITEILLKVALSVVDCWLEPQSSQSKNYKIDICCFSAKYTAFGRKSRLVGLAVG